LGSFYVITDLDMFRFFMYLRCYKIVSELVA